MQYASVVARRVFSVTCLPERGHVRTSIASMDERFSFGDAGAACIREPRYDDMPGEGVAKLQRYLQALQAELLTKHRGLLHGAPIVNDAFDWSPYK